MFLVSSSFLSVSHFLFSMFSRAVFIFLFHFSSVYWLSQHSCNPIVFNISFVSVVHDFFLFSSISFLYIFFGSLSFFILKIFLQNLNLSIILLFFSVIQASSPSIKLLFTFCFAFRIYLAIFLCSFSASSQFFFPPHISAPYSSVDLPIPNHSLASTFTDRNMFPLFTHFIYPIIFLAFFSILSLYFFHFLLFSISNPRYLYSFTTLISPPPSSHIFFFHIPFLFLLIVSVHISLLAHVLCVD